MKVTIKILSLSLAILGVPVLLDLLVNGMGEYITIQTRDGVIYFATFTAGFCFAVLHFIWKWVDAYKPKPKKSPQKGGEEKKEREIPITEDLFDSYALRLAYQQGLSDGATKKIISLLSASKNEKNTLNVLGEDWVSNHKIKPSIKGKKNESKN